MNRHLFLQKKDEGPTETNSISKRMLASAIIVTSVVFVFIILGVLDTDHKGYVHSAHRADVGHVRLFAICARW